MSVWLYEVFLTDNLEKKNPRLSLMLLWFLYLLKIGKLAVAPYLPMFVYHPDGQMP